MSAIVIALRGRYAAILSDDGCVTRIRNRGYALGQAVPLEGASSVVVKRIVSWTAAAAALVLIGTAGWHLYATPYAYVSLDVNPSIAYIVNCFERVIGVSAVNSDGGEVIRDIQLANKSIDTAVRVTLDQIASKGYFNETISNGLVLSTSCRDEEASIKLAQRLEKSVQEETGTLNANVQVETLTVPKTQVDAAKELGVTPGKLNLVGQLRDAAKDPEAVDMKAWLEQPVGTILDEIKATQQNKPQTPPPVIESLGGVESSQSAPSSSGVLPSDSTESKESSAETDLSGSGASDSSSNASGVSENSKSVPESSETISTIPESAPSLPASAAETSEASKTSQADPGKKKESVPRKEGVSLPVSAPVS